MSWNNIKGRAEMLCLFHFFNYCIRFLNPPPPPYRVAWRWTFSVIFSCYILGIFISRFGIFWKIFKIQTIAWIFLSPHPLKYRSDGSGILPYTFFTHVKVIKSFCKVLLLDTLQGFLYLAFIWCYTLKNL